MRNFIRNTANGKSRAPRHVWILNGALLGLLSAATFPASADIERGRTLHQTHCISCHAAQYGSDGTEIYTRANRRVNSLDGLRKQIRRCETNLGLTWFDEQIDDVTEYLNAQYYKLKE